MTLGLQGRTTEVSVLAADAELKRELTRVAEAGLGVLSLSVRDDGVGGADPDGSGTDRPAGASRSERHAEADQPGRGTRVDVRLPAAAR